MLAFWHFVPPCSAAGRERPFGAGSVQLRPTDERVQLAAVGRQAFCAGRDGSGATGGRRNGSGCAAHAGSVRSERVAPARHATGIDAVAGHGIR